MNQKYRLTLIPLLLIWLIPLAGIAILPKPEAVIGSPAYTVLAILYLAGLVGIGALIVRPSQRLRDAVMRPIRWVQDRPWLFIILFYLAVELWFLIQRFRYDPVSHGGLGPLAGLKTVVVQIKDGYAGQVTVLLGFALLAEVYAVGLVLFAERTWKQIGELALNIGLFVFSIGLAFVVFSIGYAGIIKREAYAQRHQIWTKLVEADDTLGYRLRPNTDLEFYHNEMERTVTFSIDGEGWRSSGYPPDAPVAGIGDSFLFGLPSDEDEMWTHTLSDELGMPVYNYGVLGYQLWQYNLVAEQYATPAGHDVVFYAIFANDLRDDSEEEQNVALLVQREIDPYRNPFTYTLHDFFDESPTYKIIQLISRSDEPPDEGAVLPGADAAELPKGLIPSCVPWAVGYSEAVNPLIVERLDRAFELAEAGGYQLFFVTLPSKENTYAEYLIPACGEERWSEIVSRERAGYTFICDTVEAKGGLCYDMTDDIRAEAETHDPSIYYRLDGHFNAEGLRVFARLIAGYMEEKGLVPGE